MRFLHLSVSRTVCIVFCIHVFQHIRVPVQIEQAVKRWGHSIPSYPRIASDKEEPIILSGYQ